MRRQDLQRYVPASGYSRVLCGGSLTFVTQAMKIATAAGLTAVSSLPKNQHDLNVD
jgi:hypothetical protein